MVRNTETILNDLKAAIDSHDWYYAMSDDYSAYTAGRASSARITALRKEAALAGCGTTATAMFKAALDKHPICR